MRSVANDMNGVANVKPRRPRRPTQAQPDSRFNGKAVKFGRRPRICLWDLVEVVGDVIPDNLGMVCVVIGFGTEGWSRGWVEIQSLSGLLSFRNVETGEIVRRGCLTLYIEASKLYRLDNGLKSNYPLCVTGRP